MNRYRIYTETRSNVPSIVARHFDSATLTTGLGLWRGEQEASTVIEILTTEESRDKVSALARDLKVSNSQVAVLITSEQVIGEFI